jgi:2-oxoglutarate ferredoxin oxidoreductase subunit gamma
MNSVELKIGGFGGQGVILAGLIIGKAATLFDGKCSTMTQSFGPEARGSSCSSQVIISGDPILYPYVVRPNILVVMSQEAYTKFSPELDPSGKLLYESELVELPGTVPFKERAGVPCTRIAEELGRKMVANIVMLGFFTAQTDVVSREAMHKAIEDSVPRGTEKLNLDAFERGYAYKPS